MKHLDLTVLPWPDYELLDSGDNRKLERFGAHLLIRPETQALWAPLHPAEWKKAVAEFAWKEGKGAWRTEPGTPERWNMAWKDARFTAHLTSFKHTGVFPEQAVNWEWIAERVEGLKSGGTARPRVLNLFGYTGIASIVAALRGADVTHVDASRQTNTWAKANAELSGVPDGALRYITDDALKFAEREIRRGSSYEGVILDPPAFGRGAKGELWKIEEHLPKLLKTLAPLLSKNKNSFFLLNGYAAGYSPVSLAQAAEGAFPGEEQEFGELRIKESQSERCVPSGIYVRFTRR